MKAVFFRLLYTTFVVACTLVLAFGYKDWKRKVYKKHLMAKTFNWAKKVSFADVKEQKRFVVTIPSYKNEPYCEKNLRSVFEQKYDNFRVIYVDDASPDRTYDRVCELVTQFDQWGRFTLLRNEINRGAMYNHVQMSQHYGDEEIVVMLDGDDSFASENVLADLNAYYADPAVWVTYGQYITYPAYEVGRCKPMKFKDLKSGKVRDLAWVTSALRTFYGGLFHRIHIEDFLYEGNYLPMSCDLAYMFPIIEMAREHVYFTPDVNYIYNRETGLHDDQIDRSKQVFFEQYVRTQPRYDRLQEHPATPRKTDFFRPVDVLIIGVDCPLELYATLDSLRVYQKHIHGIHVLYHHSSERMKRAYARLQAEFVDVNFVAQKTLVAHGGNGFKSYLMKILEEKVTDYLLLLSTGTVIDPALSLEECLADLEHTHAQAYYLHASASDASAEQQILHLLGMREGVYGAPYSAEGQREIEAAHSPYASIQKKETVRQWVKGIEILLAPDFQRKWAYSSCHHHSILALCPYTSQVSFVYNDTGLSKDFFSSQGLERFLEGTAYSACLDVRPQKKVFSEAVSCNY